MLGRRHNLQRAGQYFARKGFVVFNCSYRLAPKHGFPASIQDAMCALRWVYAHAADYDGDPSWIGVWGDSAGGHLSAMMAVGQHEVNVHPACGCAPAQEVPVSAAVHFYGVFDFVRFANNKFPLVKGIVKAVIGESENVDALLAAVSPERQVRRGHIPPTLLLCGARDPLLGETRRYARRLQELGADVRTKIYPHGVHGFLNLWWTHEGKDSVRMACEHFSKYLKPAVGQKAA
jgi:acetyl esterase